MIWGYHYFWKHPGGYPVSVWKNLQTSSFFTNIWSLEDVRRCDACISPSGINITQRKQVDETHCFKPLLGWCSKSNPKETYSKRNGVGLKDCCTICNVRLWLWTISMFEAPLKAKIGPSWEKLIFETRANLFKAAKLQLLDKKRPPIDRKKWGTFLEFSNGASKNRGTVPPKWITLLKRMIWVFPKFFGNIHSDSWCA